MINSDLLASVYTLLDNASEKELSPPVALEQLASVLNIMKYEKRLGNLDDVITKGTVTFSDTTGIKPNTLTNFGDVVYLEFNGAALEESPVSQLDLYYNSGIQRVAFWSDESGADFIQLSIPETGELKVWYEPDVAQSGKKTNTTDFADSLRWCIASRVALACLPYVKYEDEFKMANKAIVYQGLLKQSEKWENIYLELVNRIGTGRPFSRLPFMAGGDW